MYQVAFSSGIFAELVPWLMLNHGRLSVLVHPNTANPRRDHLADPIWIGSALDVHGDRLPEDSEAEPAPAPNTNPTLAP
jgi:DOPA 4,5-dioxygenase